MYSHVNHIYVIQFFFNWNSFERNVIYTQWLSGLELCNSKVDGNINFLYRVYDVWNLDFTFKNSI